MKNKFKILLILVISTITLSLISNTYSRYVAATVGNLETEFSRWQLLVNNVDITNNKNSEIIITPTINENVNTKKDTLAPASKGYFDIDIDPSNVDVSFNYNISLEVLNAEMPDLIITNYAKLNKDYVEGDLITLNSVDSSVISENYNYSELNEGQSFEPFKIRVYFEWYDDLNENLNDDNDINIVNAIDDIQIKVNIKFNQII